MCKKYRVLATLAGCVLLFLIVLAGLSSPIAFSGGATPTSFNYLPLILVAEGTPTNTPMPTNTPAPTAIPPGAVPNVSIDQIVYDPSSGTDLEGEYVRILNNEAGPVELTGWRLSDIADTTFIFPAFVLPAGATVRVWVKDGADNSAELYWGRGRAVWNNAGDTAFLKNSNDVLVDSCSYPGGGVSAGCN